MINKVLCFCILIFSLLFSYGCSSSKETETNEILTEGLIAYYSFTGNANDESGHFFNGTVYGASLVEDRKGNDGSAYFFDGNYNFINIGNVDTLKITGDLSISVWLRALTFQGSGLGIITCQANNSEDTGTNALYKINFVNKNYLNYNHESGQGDNNRHEFNNFYFDSSAWYHLVLVREKSAKALRLYIDGQLVETSYFDNDPSNGEYSTVKIGENHGTSNPDRFFHGALDDIRIYNRVLKPYEIAQLFKE